MKENIDVTMYIKPTCPYCHNALALLEQKEVKCDIIDIAQFPERREEMIARAGGRTTVPQIFIGQTHVGGCDDLYALNSQGKLDALLAGD